MTTLQFMNATMSATMYAYCHRTLALLALVCALCCTTPQTTHAQGLDGRLFSLEMGVAHTNTTQLQQFLPDGAKKLNPVGFSMGFGFSHYKRRFMLAWGFYGSSSALTPQRIDNLRVLHNHFGFTMNFGYAAYMTRTLQFGPQIGIGWGASSVVIRQAGEVALQDLKQDYGRELNLMHNTEILDLGLGMQGRVVADEPNPKYPEYKSGIYLGFRVGYIVGIKHDYWRYGAGRYTDRVTGAPDFNPSSFYARLTLSYGGFEPLKAKKKSKAEAPKTTSDSK